MRRADLRRGFHVNAGPLASAIDRDRQRAAECAALLWERDPAAWTTDVTVAKTIANRLGWIAAPEMVAGSLDRLRETAATVTARGIQDVVLLGMGGSSLAPEVLRAVIGIRAGAPRFHMLDSTDPAAVLAVQTDLKRTLFVLASKSGTTIEPNSLAAHFRHELTASGIPRWADHFVAITDPGTELAQRAANEQFTDSFINPPDIGGRYSALSYFGMVPAALMGQDVAAILDWAAAMFDEAQAPGEVLANPAVGLGLVMAAGARAGRDKLTLVVPPALEPFGLWVEQLVAESTGKQGVGVIPIAGETLGPPSAYGHDRLFVRLRGANDPEEAGRDRAMQALAGAPVVTIDFPEPAALGAEFARWEVATAIAGALLGINPFDEPNVQQAKDATKVLLSAYTSKGTFPARVPDDSVNDATLTLSAAAKATSRPAREFLSLAKPADYLGVLAYVGPDPALYDAMHRFRMTVRDRAAIAGMFGYGPRYLHSTGQLHKGGPNTGLFVLITATPTTDVAIPDQPFSFATLELAQGLGDFNSLDAAGRRAIHIHLPSPDARLLDETLQQLAGYAPRP